MSRRGFTLTEMLVVIAIIGVLMGLLLTGIMRARASARGTQQLNDIRQLHTGWTLYAGQSGDACLPGMISADVQRAWRLSFRLDRKPEGAANDKADRIVSQTYPWRLMPFVDFSYQVMFGYRLADDPEATATGTAPIPLDPRITLPEPIRALATNASLQGRAIAMEPSFGYNAHYLGGWWTMGTSSNGEPTPKPMFNSPRPMPPVAEALRLPLDRPFDVITRKVGSVRRPEQMVVFATSTYEPGLPNLFDGSRKPNPGAAGAAWCEPPFLGNLEAWTNRVRSGPDDLPRTGGAVPLARYTSDVPTVMVDGSTRGSTFRQLSDMRSWLNLPDLPNRLSNAAVHTEDR